MPSLRSKLLNFILKQTVKKQLGRAAEISEVRERVESRAAKYTPPKSVIIEKEQGAPVPGEWVRRRDGKSVGTLLYLHGGGYQFGSPVSHRPLTTYLARRLPAQTFVPDYRLAPEHKFPCALDDAIAAYDWLLDQGIKPSEIVVSGDSAGGGLSAALLLALRDREKPLPAAAALLSPYTDIAATGASLDLNEKTCAMFTADLIKNVGDAYHGDYDAKHPLVSPVYADPTGLPPLLIHASTHECLLDDATRLATRADRAGVDVTFKLWEGMPHVWHIFNAYIPEAREACEEVTAFLRAELTAGDVLHTAPLAEPKSFDTQAANIAYKHPDNNNKGGAR